MLTYSPGPKSIQQPVGYQAARLDLKSIADERKDDSAAAAAVPNHEYDFSQIPIFPQDNDTASTSLFEREKARPEDAVDAVGLVTPTAATHNQVVRLITSYGLAAPYRTLAYGYTAWSPRRSATFPNVHIQWKRAGKQWRGIVKRTTAAMGVMKALYVKPGTYRIPGATGMARYPQCGPRGKRVPLYSKVNAGISRLAKTAEQEHCNDYQRAFNLSLRRCANLINAIAGRSFGPATRNAVERMVLRRIGGKTPRLWVRELNRLTRLSLQRDLAAHRLTPDGNPKTCPTDCSRLTYTTVKSPTTKIPGVPSQRLIK